MLPDSCEYCLEGRGIWVLQGENEVASTRDGSLPRIYVSGDNTIYAARGELGVLVQVGDIQQPMFLC